MEELLIQDPAVAQTIIDEAERQVTKLELIASENFVSTAVRQAQGSILTTSTPKGTRKRWYGGCEHVDVVEDLARDRAKDCSVQDMLMSSPIPVPKLTWPCSSPAASPEIPCSAWTCPTAGT